MSGQIDGTSEDSGRDSRAMLPRPAWWPRNPYPERATIATRTYDRASRECWAALCDWLEQADDDAIDDLRTELDVLRNGH